MLPLFAVSACCCSCCCCRSRYTDSLQILGDFYVSFFSFGSIDIDVLRSCHAALYHVFVTGMRALLKKIMKNNHYTLFAFVITIVISSERFTADFLLFYVFYFFFFFLLFSILKSTCDIPKSVFLFVENALSHALGWLNFWHVFICMRHFFVGFPPLSNDFTTACSMTIRVKH